MAPVPQMYSTDRWKAPGKPRSARRAPNPAAGEQQVLQALRDGFTISFVKFRQHNLGK